MASRSQSLDAELARWAEENRAWGLYQLNLLYARIDERNIDRSFALILPLLLGLYAAMVIRTLDTVDEYWHMKARLGGYYMQFDWRNSRYQLPTKLPSGMPLESYMGKAPAGIKRLIADGMDAKDAIDLSKRRSAQVYRTITHQLIRDTNGYRSDMLNFTNSAVRRLPPAPTVTRPQPVRPEPDRVPIRPQPAPQLRPVPQPRPVPRAIPPTVSTPVARTTPEMPGDLTRETVKSLIPQKFAPWLDELENIANERLAPDAVPDLMIQDVRNYRATPKSRWRRVPSAGACGYCLTLATRGSVYYSERNARAADHANCRCQVIVNMGLPGLVISEADYRRLTERNPDGSLKSWTISSVPGKKRGYTKRYTYTYTLADFDFAVYRGDKPPIARWGD